MNMYDFSNKIKHYDKWWQGTIGWEWVNMDWQLLSIGHPSQFSPIFANEICVFHECNPHSWQHQFFANLDIDFLIRFSQTVTINSKSYFCWISQIFVKLLEKTLARLVKCVFYIYMMEHERLLTWLLCFSSPISGLHFYHVNPQYPPIAFAGLCWLCKFPQDLIVNITMSRYNRW